MKRFRGNLSPTHANDPIDDSVSRVSDRRSGSNIMKSVGIVVVCLLILPVLLTVSSFYRQPSSVGNSGFAEARSFRTKDEEVQHSALDGVRESAETTDFNKEPEKDFKEEPKKVIGSDEGSSPSILSPEDRHLGGLLVAGQEEASCLSRYQSSLYRKAQSRKPSSYLLSKLRKYEALHKRCGPYTAPYDKTLKRLKSGHNSEPAECNYVVWISFSGLGNRILSLASAFLYAVLTNRVLLVDRGTDMADLFCEPFTDTSWLLPVDFPISMFDSFGQNSSHCYGNMVKNNVINNSNESFPPFLYLHLVHDYGDHDKLFFCDQDQTLLNKVPWLFIKTDNYFVPSLFLVPSFVQELHNLFPEKDTVFHHLGRYLFHPSNPVWGLITRYYHAYLENADERIGIQIRVFDIGTGPFQHVMDQILACSLKEKLLPEVNTQEHIIRPSRNQRSKAVLITSLNAGYFEQMRNMFWEYPSVTGEVIAVYQPSSEVHQQTEKKMHNRKAWAEMYLLSLTDVLVTSSWSTFGYVAQGLGGLKPWILYKPENRTAPDPPCRRAMSMDPCFHAPPFYDCKAKTGIDTGALVPHVRHCEDMSWGLKLVDSEL